MTIQNPECLFAKIIQGTVKEYLVYFSALLEFHNNPVPGQLANLPPMPWGLGSSFPMALAEATSWGEEEESAARFFCHLARIHSKSANAEKYTAPLTAIVQISHALDLKGLPSNGDKIIAAMQGTGFSPQEIASIYNIPRWGCGLFVPLTTSNIVRDTALAARSGQTEHEGPKAIGTPAPVTDNCAANADLSQLHVGSTCIERYLMNLPDEMLLQVLDGLDGHIHILESTARGRAAVAKEWLAGRALESLDPKQIQALVQGSAEFDEVAQLYIRANSRPASQAPVIWQLCRLRPLAHRSLRDEYYQKPEIAVWPQVMGDLSDAEPVLAIRLLKEGLTKRLHLSVPAMAISNYRPTFCAAARLWNEEAKELFSMLEELQDARGIQTALEELAEYAPLDADADFDKTLALLCHSRVAYFLIDEMLTVVKKKRPDRMIDGWWAALDRDPREGPPLAAPALAEALGKEAMAGVETRLRHAKPGIRIGAIAVLAELGDADSLTRLTAHLQCEEHDKVRNAIHQALKRHGATPTPEAVDNGNVGAVLGSLEAELGRKMAKAKLPPGDWWRVGVLAELKALDGTVVSSGVIDYLVHEHTKLKTIEPAPDTLQLIACLDKQSAADYALALLNAWLAEGQDAKHRWVLALAGTLGDSRVIPTLLPWIPKWCEAARHKLAEYAAQGISLIGSDQALMVLDTLSTRYRSKFRNVGAAAAAAFQSAARARGISPDELGDLVVPSLDFSEDGLRRFEWDGGAAVAELSAELKLEWSDPDKERPLKGLPASAPEAVKGEVKELGKRLRETGKAQILRLEQALVKQRRWAVPAWRRLYENHPILRAYATRLVWGVYTADGNFRRAFRRYPNGILADAAGAMEELPEDDAWIGLLHPLDLDSAGLAAWRAHLARFKVQPPFPQLERPVERLEPLMHNRRNLAMAEGREISYATFRSRAEKRGWVRGSVIDAGGVSSYYKLFPGAGVEVSLETTGLYMGMDPMETLTLGTARFCTAGSILRGSYVYDEPAENDPRILTFGQVPPVVYSETVSDLKAIIAQKEAEGFNP